ncbi:M15 family metallopeptidase [Asticcacaulis sp. YBE204]|uniref:M15 family metallopeptidase n=1 Tax=Asticcacaulis sp. YBE204 TaxID=1282363 RepID=UPI0003C40816|nr:M15 family metallopeptidase [Asticcacaulis sp. YBE204]ESQ81335.1 hypothetical protein AEYBE204_03055 [Asticcacaulis sp. YBE204]
MPLVTLAAFGGLVACTAQMPLTQFQTVIDSLETRTREAFPRYVDCRSAYGDPALTATSGEVRADPQWEADNLVMVKLPWKAHAAWSPKIAIRSLQVHRLAAPSLERALAAIWAQAGQNQGEIERVGLDAIGGGYNFRPIRKSQGSSATLSTHAYGCAVDFDPLRNALGDTSPNLSAAENRYVIEAFRAEGWVWGGHWPHPDGMHFQAARIAVADDTVAAR